MRDTDHSSALFLKRLKALQSDEELRKQQRYFKFVVDDQSADDYFIGVRMGSVFNLAKEFTEMPLGEIEKLLESPIHEARAGAVSLMDFKAWQKNFGGAPTRSVRSVHPSARSY